MSDTPSERMVARFGQINADGTYNLGMYARIDPADPTYTLVFDQVDITPNCIIEVTQPTDRYKLRFVDANRLVTFLGLPDKPVAHVVHGGLVRSFESRPADAWGGSEQPLIVTLPNGLILASVPYTQDGRQWMTTPLTLERVP